MLIYVRLTLLPYYELYYHININWAIIKWDTWTLPYMAALWYVGSQTTSLALSQWTLTQFLVILHFIVKHFNGAGAKFCFTKEFKICVLLLFPR